MSSFFFLQRSIKEKHEIVYYKNVECPKTNDIHKKKVIPKGKY